VRNLAMVKITEPAGLKNPNGLMAVPVSAGRVDAPLISNVAASSSKTFKVAEKLLIRVEEFVIVNFRVFAQNPLPARLVVGLRGAALDLIAESVLALIGRKGDTCHPAPRARPQASVQPSREGQKFGTKLMPPALNATSSLFLVHNAERDQRSTRRPAGRVDKTNNCEIDEIAEHFEQPGTMLRNVVQELEKREYLESKIEANGQK